MGGGGWVMSKMKTFHLEKKIGNYEWPLIVVYINLVLLKTVWSADSAIAYQEVRMGQV